MYLRPSSIPTYLQSSTFKIPTLIFPTLTFPPPSSLSPQPHIPTLISATTELATTFEQQSGAGNSCVSNKVQKELHGGAEREKKMKI
jgi:hypothetical protein